MQKIKHNHPTYFHLNFSYHVNHYFAELDWFLINYRINKLCLNHQISICSLVMMNTHVHILFQSLQNNENFFVEDIFKELEINAEEPNDRPLCEPITDKTQFLNTYKYIYQNPVQAGLAEFVEEYPYSTLQILLGKSQLRLKIIDPLSFQQNPFKILKWLNSPTTSHFYTKRNYLDIKNQYKTK